MDNEVTIFGAAVECVFQQNYATRVWLDFDYN